MLTAMATASGQSMLTPVWMARVRTSPKAAPLDVLDHDVRLAAGVGGRLEDLRHAVVLELGLDPRLVEEPRQERGVAGVVAADDLDHTGPLGPSMPVVAAR